MVWTRYAGPFIRASGGTSYGATKRLRGAREWCGEGMRMQPLGPQLEFPMGLRIVCGVRRNGVDQICGPWH
eukprot:4005839-Pyramimonas_sp.AAC.1